MTQRAQSLPVLRCLGVAVPPPFVGRHKELAAIVRALDDSVVLVVHGPGGVGKTRLGHEVAGQVEARSATYVRCLPGDRGVAVAARAERMMDLLPGTLAQVLENEPRLLILDDVHHLREDDLARTLASWLPARGVPGSRFLLLTRGALPLRRQIARFDMSLSGLEAAPARELWSHLENIYGPAAPGAWDVALARTRGMPLELCREYACAALGEDAWNAGNLEPTVRAALQTMAVLRVAVTPAALAALVPGVDTAAVLADLVARQLIEPMDDGSFTLPNTVRDQVLGTMDSARRVVLERAAAEHFSGREHDARPGQPWHALGNRSFGYLDPIDRMREAVFHFMAAGEPESAVACLVAGAKSALGRGAGGEITALIDELEAWLGAAEVRSLNNLRAIIAARHGRIAEALEIATTSDGAVDAVEMARLRYRAGNPDLARQLLAGPVQSADPGERCRAAALLSEIELACGAPGPAEALVTTAFKRDAALIDETTRARLHMTLAAVYEHMGRLSAARAALARAASAGSVDPGLVALIEARRSVCLAREGRLSEAESALGEAECAAREVDSAAVADEIRQCRSVVALRRGELPVARNILAELVRKRRLHGDEIGALMAEVELAGVHARSGELSHAAELCAASTATAARHGLETFHAAAQLASAVIDLIEMRLDSAERVLDQIALDNRAAAAIRTQAGMLLVLVRAARGHDVTPDDLDSVFAAVPELYDDVEVGQMRAEVAFACRMPDLALQAVQATAARAERAGRAAELTCALALSARLYLARGDKLRALAAATRAVSESVRLGLVRARVHGLLVLAAVAREQGQRSVMAGHVREVSELAAASGLVIEHLAAVEAGEAAWGMAAGAAHHVAVATISQAGRDAAARLLADLGLTAARPYRVIGAAGAESFVADASPERLCMTQRSLVIDGVREVIVRDGRTAANLRRRSLLKRLLFLFAAAPGRVFSKEEIVELIWHVEYHPLRHDAALFTNIMRIRRLLGQDGADLIRVGEDGYRFVPPDDFLYVEPAAADNPRQTP